MLIRLLILAVLSTGLAGCSDLGTVFLTNQTEQQVEVAYDDRVIMLPAAGQTKRYRRRSKPPSISVSIGECRYTYQNARFYEAVIDEDLDRFNRKVSLVIEIAIYPNGDIRMYQFNKKTGSRIFEVKPSGSRIVPLTTTGGPDC